MSLLAGLLLWGFSLDPASAAATCILRDAMGLKPLYPPRLFADPVSWMTPGLTTFLVCLGRVRGVTFVLKREDNGYQEIAETDGVLAVTEPGDEERAIFVVHQPGNYSCSYYIHEECASSEPSHIVTIKEYVKPLPPMLTTSEDSTVVPPRMAQRILVCVAPLNDVEFQLRQGELVLKVPSISASPERVSFYLKISDMGDQSPFTCRYRLNSISDWSENSNPVEIMWSDETLQAPAFTAEPSSNETLKAGSTVQLRCTAPKAPKAGLRFALHREHLGERSLLQTLKSSGNEIVFQLHNLSAADSASYSCIYIERQPPFSGSAPSEPVELMVNGPPPPPTLQALWRNKVFAGDDVVLRCQSPVPGVTMELLHNLRFVPHQILRVHNTWSDLGLTSVGPQHTGNYTCRYISWWTEPFYSKLSNPVELLVEGN
ncbi:alpha-1B-glycoprotein [Psammomys obesus]|uniref:alpha-1B-glycoprotein n=1 Tax=Psammomys obesus TaxID=48139 RepID=UPI002453034E|nr:alpha-1B-glycoprotein [Psammomys obesus]